MTRILYLVVIALTPAAIFAESATPSLGYTGAPTDHGGQDCSTCHNTYGPANSDKTGSLQVLFESSKSSNGYVPSMQQLIRIIVQNPNASRWGFQMTIREQSNESLSSGTFAIPSGTNSSNYEQVACDNGTQYGSAPPCTTAMVRQFAEHQNAPRGATGTAYEFDVLWTPPEQEIGRLEVYVAAVAANGDGTPYGDRVYTSTQVLPNVGNCALAGTPTFQSIVNGASFQPGFSSGSMVTIYGTNFQTSGNQRVAGLGDFVNGAYPTELGCVSVEVTGPGITQPVQLPIAYASFGQINAQIPDFSGTGPVNLKVTLNPGSNGVDSAVATLNSLQEYSPAFFTFPNSTSVAAEEANTYSIVADPSVVTGAAPAKPGDVVLLFGTGFGATNPAVAPGALATGIATLTTQVAITIGGITLSPSEILYAGLSPGSISGLYQFNIQIPSNVPSGEAPISISIGGFETQAGVTIPIQ